MIMQVVYFASPAEEFSDEPASSLELVGWSEPVWCGASGWRYSGRHLGFAIWYNFMA